MAQDIIGTLPDGTPAFVGAPSTASMPPASTVPTIAPVTPVAPSNPLAPAVSPVVTSAPASAQYDALQQQIQRMAQVAPSAPVVYQGQSYNDTGALIDAQRSALERRRAEEVARLDAQFAAAGQRQEQSQKVETGTKSMGLARIGGFDSMSGQSVLTNLQRTHESEVLALETAKSNALRQAQNAYDDKDFELAQLQLEESRKIQDTIYARQQDYLSNTLALRGEMRSDLNQQLQQSQFEYSKERDRKQDQTAAKDFAYKANIKSPFFVVGGVGYDSSTGDALSYDEYIARGGKPDFSNAQVISANSELERAYVFDMASKYPDAGIDPSNDTAVGAQQKISNSKLYLDDIGLLPGGKNGISRRGGAGGGGGGGGGGGAAVNSTYNYGKEITNNKVRARALALKKGSADPYEAWGQAAREITDNGGNPTDYDETFWNVFRPGEDYETLSPQSSKNKKATSRLTGSKIDSLFD